MTLPFITLTTPLVLCVTLCTTNTHGLTNKDTQTIVTFSRISNEINTNFQLS